MLTPEEIALLLELLAGVKEALQGIEGVDGVLQKLEQLVFLGQVCALGIACMWGAMIWQAVIVGKNQRRF